MRKIGLWLLVAMLALGAWECSAAPKSQCRDGSTKVEVKNGHSTRYHCYNGEWSKQK